MRRVSTETDGADRLAVRANKLDLLERLADDLAHEIKNPLHSMVINLEVLKRRISRAEPDGQNDMLRYVSVVGSELDRVSQRIEMLLRMIRPGRNADSGTLNDLIEELLELLAVETRRRSVQIRFEPEQTGARTYVPPGPVRQVLLNLVLEVLDTLSSGDSLHLRVEKADPAARVVVTAHAAEPVGAGVWPGAGGNKTESSELRSRLPIARALGEALGGHVDVDPSPDGAMSLSFVLPHQRSSLG